LSRFKFRLNLNLDKWEGVHVELLELVQKMKNIQHSIIKKFKGWWWQTLIGFASWI
jgi:hypothetical protein